MKTNATKSQYFENISLPVRTNPVWESNSIAHISDRNTLLKVISGKLPIGILQKSLITEAERIILVEELLKLQIKKYDNTDPKQKVEVFGKPFVDSETVTKHLTSGIDEKFDAITTPLFERLLYEFSQMGFNPQPLIDPITLLLYPAKVCRLISIPKGCYTERGNECSVLHCDDIIRDGLMKPDFRLPVGFEHHQYFQFSVCIQLEDGGFRPDALFVYEKQFSAELQGDFMENNWQLPIEKVSDTRYASYTPELGATYLFSTLNFHDVKGGDPRAKRLNFSVFFIYIPETNQLFYYN